MKGARRARRPTVPKPEAAGFASLSSTAPQMMPTPGVFTSTGSAVGMAFRSPVSSVASPTSSTFSRSTSTDQMPSLPPSVHAQESSAQLGATPEEPGASPLHRVVRRSPSQVKDDEDWGQMINALSPKGSLRSSRSVRSSLSVRSRPRSPEAVDAPGSPWQQQSARKQTAPRDEGKLSAVADSIPPTCQLSQTVSPPSTLANAPITDIEKPDGPDPWPLKGHSAETESSDTSAINAAQLQAADFGRVGSEFLTASKIPTGSSVVQDKTDGYRSGCQRMADVFSDGGTADISEKINIAVDGEACNETLPRVQSDMPGFSSPSRNVLESNEGINSNLKEDDWSSLLNVPTFERGLRPSHGRPLSISGYRATPLDLSVSEQFSTAENMNERKTETPGDKCLQESRSLQMELGSDGGQAKASNQQGLEDDSVSVSSNRRDALITRDPGFSNVDTSFDNKTSISAELEPRADEKVEHAQVPFCDASSSDTGTGQARLDVAESTLTSSLPAIDAEETVNRSDTAPSLGRMPPGGNIEPPRIVQELFAETALGSNHSHPLSTSAEDQFPENEEDGFCSEGVQHFPIALPNETGKPTLAVPPEIVPAEDKDTVSNVAVVSMTLPATSEDVSAQPNTLVESLEEQEMPTSTTEHDLALLPSASDNISDAESAAMRLTMHATSKDVLAPQNIPAESSKEQEIQVSTAAQDLARLPPASDNITHGESTFSEPTPASFEVVEEKDNCFAARESENDGRDVGREQADSGVLKRDQNREVTHVMADCRSPDSGLPEVLKEDFSGIDDGLVISRDTRSGDAALIAQAQDDQNSLNVSCDAKEAFVSTVAVRSSFESGEVRDSVENASCVTEVPMSNSLLPIGALEVTQFSLFSSNESRRPVGDTSNDVDQFVSQEDLATAGTASIFGKVSALIRKESNGEDLSRSELASMSGAAMDDARKVDEASSSFPTGDQAPASPNESTVASKDKMSASSEVELLSSAKPSAALPLRDEQSSAEKQPKPMAVPSFLTGWDGADGWGADADDDDDDMERYLTPSVFESCLMKGLGGKTSSIPDLSVSLGQLHDSDAPRPASALTITCNTFEVSPADSCRTAANHSLSSGLTTLVKPSSPTLQTTPPVSHAHSKSPNSKSGYCPADSLGPEIGPISSAVTGIVVPVISGFSPKGEVGLEACPAAKSETPGKLESVTSFQGMLESQGDVTGLENDGTIHFQPVGDSLACTGADHLESPTCKEAVHLESPTCKGAEDLEGPTSKGAEGLHPKLCPEKRDGSLSQSDTAMHLESPVEIWKERTPSFNGDEARRCQGSLQLAGLLQDKNSSTTASSQIGETMCTSSADPEATTSPGGSVGMRTPAAGGLWESSDVVLGWGSSIENLGMEIGDVSDRPSGGIDDAEGEANSTRQGDEISMPGSEADGFAETGAETTIPSVSATAGSPVPSEAPSWWREWDRMDGAPIVEDDTGVYSAGIESSTAPEHGEVLFHGNGLSDQLASSQHVTTGVELRPRDLNFCSTTAIAAHAECLASSAAGSNTRSSGVGVSMAGSSDSVRTEDHQDPHRESVLVVQTDVCSSKSDKVRIGQDMMEKRHSVDNISRVLQDTFEVTVGPREGLVEEPGKAFASAALTDRSEFAMDEKWCFEDESDARERDRRTVNEEGFVEQIEAGNMASASEHNFSSPPLLSAAVSSTKPLALSNSSLAEEVAGLGSQYCIDQDQTASLVPASDDTELAVAEARFATEQEVRGWAEQLTSAMSGTDNLLGSEHCKSTDFADWWAPEETARPNAAPRAESSILSSQSAEIDPRIEPYLSQYAPDAGFQDDTLRDGMLMDSTDRSHQSRSHDVHDPGFDVTNMATANVAGNVHTTGASWAEQVELSDNSHVETKPVEDTEVGGGRALIDESLGQGLINTYRSPCSIPQQADNERCSDPQEVLVAASDERSREDLQTRCQIPARGGLQSMSTPGIRQTAADDDALVVSHPEPSYDASSVTQANDTGVADATEQSVQGLSLEVDPTAQGFEGVAIRGLEKEGPGHGNGNSWFSDTLREDVEAIETSSHFMIASSARKRDGCLYVPNAHPIPASSGDQSTHCAPSQKEFVHGVLNWSVGGELKQSLEDHNDGKFLCDPNEANISHVKPSTNLQGAINESVDKAELSIAGKAVYDSCSASDSSCRQPVVEGGELGAENSGEFNGGLESGLPLDHSVKVSEPSHGHEVQTGDGYVHGPRSSQPPATMAYGDETHHRFTGVAYVTPNQNMGTFHEKESRASVFHVSTPGPIHCNDTPHVALAAVPLSLGADETWLAPALADDAKLPATTDLADNANLRWDADRPYGSQALEPPTMRRESDVSNEGRGPATQATYPSCAPVGAIGASKLSSLDPITSNSVLAPDTHEECHQDWLKLAPEAPFEQDSQTVLFDRVHAGYSLPEASRVEMLQPTVTSDTRWAAAESPVADGRLCDHRPSEGMADPYAPSTGISSDAHVHPVPEYVRMGISRIDFSATCGNNVVAVNGTDEVHTTDPKFGTSDMFSIMDNGVPSGIHDEPPRGVITWGFGGSLVVVCGSSGGHGGNVKSRHSFVGYHCSAREAQSYSTTVRLFNVNELTRDCMVDDWVAAAEAPVLDPVLDRERHQVLESYAGTCDRLATLSVGQRPQVIESRAAMWRVLSTICRNATKDWLTNMPAALTGPSPVRLFARGSDMSAIGGVPESVLIPGAFGINTSEDSMNQSAALVEELLVAGNAKEAAERAVQSGLWPLALIAATVVDRKTYLDVMSSFARDALLNGSRLQMLCLGMAENIEEILRIATTPQGLEKWRQTVAVLAGCASQPHLQSSKYLQAIEQIGTALFQLNKDNVGCHVCYLISGRLKRLSCSLATVGSLGTPLLGASELISAGRPQSLGSCAAVLQSMVLEASHVEAGGDRYVHLLPFRLILVQEMAVIGRSEVALSHCELLMAAVKDALAKNEPDATRYLTAPFLASLESFEVRLRSSLGQPAQKHGVHLLARLRPSVARAVQSVTSVTSLGSRNEISSASADFKQDQGSAIDPTVIDGTNLESTPEQFRSFTPRQSRASIPQSSQVYIPQGLPVNTLSQAGTHNADRDQGSSSELTAWSTTAVMARVIDTLAADDQAPSPVHPASQASGQRDSTTDGGYVIPPPMYGRNRGPFPEQESNPSAFQAYGHQISPEAAVSSAAPNISQQPSSIPENVEATTAVLAEKGTLSGQIDAKPAKAVADKGQGISSSRRWAIFGRLPRIISEKVTPVFGGRPQAHLGQKNSLVYNKELGRWVEEGQEIAEEDLALPPPPDDDVVERTGHFDNPYSGSGREYSPETSSVQPSTPTAYQQHAGTSSLLVAGTSSPRSYGGPNMHQPGNPGALSPSSRLQTTISADAPSAILSPEFAGFVSHDSQDSGAPPFNSGIQLPDRIRTGSGQSEAPPANANRFRAGRRVGRAAYVDTFNPKPKSTSATPTPSPCSAGPVLPARQAGVPYRIFTPAAVCADTSADDNVSATSESTNALASTGNGESFGRNENHIRA